MHAEVNLPATLLSDFSKDMRFPSGDHLVFPISYSIAG